MLWLAGPEKSTATSSYVAPFLQLLRHPPTSPRAVGHAALTLAPPYAHVDASSQVTCLQYLGYQLPEVEYEKQYAIADQVRSATIDTLSIVPPAFMLWAYPVMLAPGREWASELR